MNFSITLAFVQRTKLYSKDARYDNAEYSRAPVERLIERLRWTNGNVKGSSRWWYLVCHHVLAEEGGLLVRRLVAGRSERRREPAQCIASVPLSARQPPQRELHMVRRQPPSTIFIYL